jgi:hypothetical protein
VEDGDPNRDIFGSEMWGTGKSKGFWRLSELEVQSWPANGQAWERWDPGADTRSNCESVTVGVTVQGAGLSMTKQRCELWDIEKGAPGGELANRWKGDVRREDRRRRRHQRP